MNATQRRGSAALRLFALAAIVGLIAPAILLAQDAKPAQQPPEGASALAELVNSMPDRDGSGKYTAPAPDVAGKAVQQILAGGKTCLVELVGMLKEPDQGEDYKARLLLHAVSAHVSRPGAEKERQAACDALASTLGGSSPAIQAAVLEELKWIGGPESVAAVAKLVCDEKLYGRAVDALVAMKAVEPLRQALPKAKGRNLVAVTQALGVLDDRDAVPVLIRLTQDTDARLAAIEALADIGDAKAADAVLAAAKCEKGTYEDMKIAEAALRLGRRLAEAGKKDDAKRIYRTLFERAGGKQGRHIRTGCFQGLVAVADEDVADVILAALSDPDVQVRAVALRTAASLPGGEMVDKWLGLLKTAPQKDRIGVLYVLGAIGDAKALPAVLAAMDDPDEKIRLEAMRSAAAIGGEAAARALVARATGKQGEAQQVAFASLAACRGAEADGLIGAAVRGKADPAAKAGLIGVLAARRASSQLDAVLGAMKDDDADVRMAAIRAMEAIGTAAQAAALAAVVKAPRGGGESETAQNALIAIGGREREQVAEAIVPELKDAKPEAAVKLFGVLGRVGGAAAAKTLTAYADNPSAEVRDAAIRVLSRWSQAQGLPEAAEGLLKIAKDAKDVKHHAMALRNYINLAGSGHWRRDVGRQLKIYREAIKIARRPEEKRAVLGALGNINHTESLTIAASCLEDKDLVEEAAAAVVKIVQQVRNKAHPDVQAALQKVVTLAANEQTVKQAERYLIRKTEKPLL